MGMLTVLTPAAQAIAVPAAAAAVAAPMSDVVRLLSMVSIGRVFSVEPEALLALFGKFVSRGVPQLVSNGRLTTAHSPWVNCGGHSISQFVSFWIFALGDH